MYDSILLGHTGVSELKTGVAFHFSQDKSQMHGFFWINAPPDAVGILKIPFPFLPVALLGAVGVMADDTIIAAVDSFRILRRIAIGVYLPKIVENLPHLFLMGIASQGVDRAIVIGDGNFCDYPAQGRGRIAGPAAAG